MATVDITCPFCNGKQKVPDHRLAEPVMCLLCGQTILEPFQHKVAPPSMNLGVGLKGKLVTDFGTTELEEVESKADAYTGRTQTDQIKPEDLQSLNSGMPIALGTGTGHYAPVDSHRKLSTAARTYLFGGALIVAVLVAVTMLFFALKTDDVESKELEGTADSQRIEKHPNGRIKTQWSVHRSELGEERMHGLWTEFYASGQKKAEGTYVDGARDGLWLGWFEDQQVQSRSLYKLGVETGDWEEFHINGKPAMKGTWIEGKKDGDWREWYRDGRPSSVTRYKGGLPDGIWSTWHENGELKSWGEYKDGRKIGRWTRYFDNLVEESVENYVDGLAQGETLGNYRNRQKAFTGTWQNGVKQGHWTQWYANGQKQFEGDFEQGKEQGPWKHWHDNGNVALEGSLQAGQRVGDWKEYWPDGSLMSQRRYDSGLLTDETQYFAGDVVKRLTERTPNGQLSSEWTVLAVGGANTRHGLYRAFHINGKTSEEGIYRQGKKDGTWRYYDDSGTLALQRVFKDGVEIPQ
ncbi:MAG: hypothetical protein IPP14_06695 [Planctomycetes bacterium]|nr:hypothetical protein [Planctomycetota bacterium]